MLLCSFKTTINRTPLTLAFYFTILLPFFSFNASLYAQNKPFPESSTPGAVLPPPLEPLGRDRVVNDLLPGLPRSQFGLKPLNNGLSEIELAPSRPIDGRGSVREFVESLKGNDASIEIILGQARILSLKSDMTNGTGEPTIATGDPSVIDFLAVSPRQIRITGLRHGTTDLSIVTSDGERYSFEVHVVADLTFLEAKLRALFPDASIRLGQINNNIVVGGEARSPQQIAQIIRAVQGFVVQTPAGSGTGSQGSAPSPSGLENFGSPTPGPSTTPDDNAPAGSSPETDEMSQRNSNRNGEQTGSVGGQGDIYSPQVINLLRVPTSQQVLLKVQVAELNRTALRRIGANFLGVDPATGSIVGSQITGVNSSTATISHPTTTASARARDLLGTASLPSTSISGQNGTTIFGIFQNANFAFTLNALRNNGFLKILAEPNLVAMSGHMASFLAGGEFPVPVPQVSSGGVAPTVTVQFKEFGVRLGFLPQVIDDGVIRLSVVPEVSEIDFAVAVTLVAGGSAVPGLNTRRAQTTVELREGQTLAIAGLLQLTLDGSTTRIPGLGDLPILGPFFSNTTSSRTEKELVVLVTPYLVEGMNQDQVPPLPGDEVKEPNDLELFLLNRMESRTGKDFRATTRWDDVFDLRHHLELEKKYVQGPVGFSE